MGIITKMKVISFIASAYAVKLHLEPVMNGIPDGTLMDKNPSHWRKIWPEGDTDAGQFDEEVINMAGPGRKGVPEVPKVYKPLPWELDEDVISTQGSIETAESMIGGKMKSENVKDRGM